MIFVNIVFCVVAVSRLAQCKRLLFAADNRLAVKRRGKSMDIDFVKQIKCDEIIQ